MHKGRDGLINNHSNDRIFNINHIDLYKLFTYFFVCAFVGWIFETSLMYYDSHHFADRGLLFVEKDFSNYFNFLNQVPYIRKIPFIWGLPIIEIYGFGGLVIVLGIGKVRHGYVALFFIGAIVLTLVELLGSYFCDYVLHQSCWDYSTAFLNFQGRICLRSFLAWGVLSILAIKYLKPYLEYLYRKETRVRHYKRLAIILMVYTLICILFKIFVFK